MNDPAEATLFLLLVLGAVMLARATVPAMLRALRGHFADRRRFPGQMDERLEGMAKVAQGGTETRENGTDGECFGSLGSGGTGQEVTRVISVVAKEANK